VGYNKGYQAGTPLQTATLPIGHADGIGRHFGKGRGVVFIQEKPAPIIGNVCMDMTMIDISGIECQEGDEVIFFGEGHSAETLAGRAGTISYELLTGISRRVPRIVVE
jgi:alanine racemase